jgi:hypothetical protein
VHWRRKLRKFQETLEDDESTDTIIDETRIDGSGSDEVRTN